MQFLRLEGTDPAYNLALEDLLFQKEDKPTLLLWRNRPAVVCGAYQNIYQEVDLPKAKAQGVSLARRSSGGGTVYHDLGNVNYSLILPDQDLGVDFGPILAQVCRALSHLGLEVTIDQTSDLVWEGKKISGNAQKKGRGKLLHHGTLLYACDLGVLSLLANGHRPYYSSKATGSRPRPVANLSQALGGDVSDTPAFMEAFAQALARDRDLEPWDLPEPLKAEANRLARDKYRSWEWTFAKSPAFRFHRSFLRPNGLRSLTYEAKKGRLVSLTTDPDLPRLSKEGLGQSLRHDTLGPLCKAYGQGIIDPDDFF